jgi:iron complex outermembrane receptor protein
MRAPLPLLAVSLFGWLALAAAPGHAQDTGPAVDPAELKNLSIEELSQLDVTSVSRRSERLSQAAAAVTVITQEELRRSGATSLPEALRLAASLHVARSTQGSWAISARGFNSAAADKMLVQIDGRSIYTPLFAGVFWDVQDVLLEDVDRIEVIRGPGATLWGANAVNGIINIITRPAADTQGGLVTAGGGTPLERAFGAVRYGGAFGEASDGAEAEDKGAAGHYRVYGKGFDRGPLVFVGGRSAQDPMRMGQGGFRSDWHATGQDAFTLQGDAYSGRLGQALRSDTQLDGGNLLGRWSRPVSERSDLEVQVYWDRTHRDIPGQFAEHRDTWDVDLQDHLRLSEKNDLVFGGGFRSTADRVGNSASLLFLPDRRTRNLFSLFAQDEIALLADRLHLTVGSKLEHNDWTGLEVQPTVRFAWTPDDHRTLWAAVSRAVRTPSRLDEDIVFLAGGRVVLQGSPDFVSEKLIAYELGYRVQPDPRLSLDAAAFYNVYTDLRSQELQPDGRIVLGNGLEAETWGLELRANCQLLPWWRLQAGATWLDKHLHLDPGSTDPTGGQGEGNDPPSRFSLRSLIDLPRGVELDAALRYVDRLPAPVVPAYLTLDLHLGWKVVRSLELALVGQNLLAPRHAEFGPATASREEIERGVYGKATWRF